MTGGVKYASDTGVAHPAYSRQRPGKILEACAFIGADVRRRAMASDSSIQASPDGGDVASQIPFHDLCALMEKIHKTQGTDKKKKILSSFIERWRETHARLHHTDAATTVRTTGQTWMGTGRTRKYLSVMIYMQ